MAGVRHSSGLKELSGTTAVALWKVTVGRGARLVKIVIYNPDTADHTVEIGELDVNGNWVAAKLPKIPVLSGQMVVLEEKDIPNEKVYSKDTSNIKQWGARLEAAVSANNVQIEVEVEEE